MKTKPNILLIFTDQQRFDTIHALGNSVIRTPNLDRLYKNGIAFTSAYSPSPVCVPARCCLHYGKYPANTGCYNNADPMPSDQKSFMAELTDHGYTTHGVGKCHFTPDRDALRGFQSRVTQEEIQNFGEDDYMNWLADNGYNDVFEPHGVRGEMYYIPQLSRLPQQAHPTQWVADRSLEFIDEHESDTDPWFLFCSFIHPHPPYAPPSPWHKLYFAPQLPLPKMPADHTSLLTYINHRQNRYKYRDQGSDKNLMRCLKANYYACISFIDYQIGRILDRLEQQGKQDNTLIVFTSDHGEHLGDYGCFGKRSMHDTCAKVPLLVSMPGRFDGGVCDDSQASLIDIAPTILRAAGIDIPQGRFDGVDLHDLHTGECGRDTVYIQFGNKKDGLYSAINDRWKYSYSAPDNKEFLFDRINDPAETRNFAGLGACDENLKAMRKILVDYLVESGETNAVDSGAMRQYPVQEVESNPDAGLLTQDPAKMDKYIPGYSD